MDGDEKNRLQPNSHAPDGWSDMWTGLWAEVRRYPWLASFVVVVLVLAIFASLTPFYTVVGQIVAGLGGIAPAPRVEAPPVPPATGAPPAVFTATLPVLVPSLTPAPLISRPQTAAPTVANAPAQPGSPVADACRPPPGNTDMTLAGPKLRDCLPASSPDPGRYALGFVAENSGEYVVKQLDPASRDLAVVDIPQRFERYAFVSATIRLVGDVTDRVVALACRDQGTPEGPSHYRLSVRPDSRELKVSRWDNGKEVDLEGGGWKASPTIERGGAFNALWLRCAGGTIKGWVGDESAGIEVTDYKYATGGAVVGVGTVPGPGRVEGRIQVLYFSWGG